MPTRRSQINASVYVHNGNSIKANLVDGPPLIHAELSELDMHVHRVTYVEWKPAKSTYQEIVH